MPLSFSPIKDKNRIDNAKFVWDQKDATMAQKKTEAMLQQSERKMDLHTRTDHKVVPILNHIGLFGDLVYLDPGPSIRHLDLDVSKYDMSLEDHKIVKHSLPDDGGV
ncbi:hypothetical protein RDI58_013344 [Solanum bulbocastanum]|uniref:Uncharacterized protein n=1 Tax=Solanum bulbocastanum TaxID=147425 RepID=A0AAN8TMM8_SOLBU